MENIFEKVKQAVSVPQAAQFYGISLDRSGKCCCLFHQDKHPSMKLNDDYYYCFACQANGDVISLTAKLFGLSKKEAAVKLAADFGLEPSESLQAVAAQKAVLRAEKDEREHALSLLDEASEVLRWWKDEYAPKHPEEEFSDDFVDVCKLLEFFQLLADPFRSGQPVESAATMTYIKEKEILQMLERALEVKKCRN